MSASRWARRRSLLLEASCLWVVLSACDGDAEAKQVLGHIDRMRDAPMAERGAHLEHLARLSPKDPRAAAAQRACLTAYRKLQAAHDEVEEASRRIEALKAEGRAPRYEEIAAADRATTLLAEAKEAEAGCATSVADLRRALR